ncbi:MAG: outer membrane protein assembly factor BamD [Calditrichaeota bacterium]|nr:MAG: outer membrane protein assembly factor BamD [Calditrichota bacterium]
MNLLKLFFLSVFLILMLQISLLGQSLQPHFGFGFAAGGQRLSGDAPTMKLAPGGEGLISYRLSRAAQLNLAVGYNLLSYQLATSPKTFTTNLIFADVFMELELFRLKALRPFLKWGVGGFNFEAFSGKRFNDAEILGGGGLKFFLGKNVALTFSGSAKYTTGDDLDTIRKNGNDIYFSARTGLMFYKGKKPTPQEQYPPANEVITESIPEAEQPQTPPAGQPQVPPASAEEIAQLKQKVAELSQDLENKNHEIEALKQALQQKVQVIQQLEQSAKAAPAPSRQPVTSYTGTGDFKSNYRLGLQKFNERQYDEAINIFQDLLNRFPHHPLASNCAYWIGESEFALGNYTRALEAFSQVLEFPQSFKKDDALLMSARAYLKLGNSSRAQQMLLRLVSNYPESEYVSIAQRYLNRLAQ